MKIIHTADWHIGKRLYENDFLEDIQLFFDWLLKTIRTEQIDALLVSGDIFDMANPSSDARSVYYQFLAAVSQLKCKVIITGGNHDSPAVLNAPKDLLSAFNVKVIGGMPVNKEEVIIPLSEKNNLVVVAIPYLRDGDLRTLVKGESYKDRKEAIRQGITKIFTDLGKTAQLNYPKSTVIAMGHLFAQGAHVSESERGIQMGNEAGIQATAFGTSYAYVALGHIHVPQTVSKTKKVYYSGSPIALSFSEKDDEKRILILDFDGKEITETSMPIPSFRKMLKFTGTFLEVEQALSALPESQDPLKTLIDITIKEAHYDPLIITRAQQMITSFNTNEKSEIIHQRILFENSIHGTATLYEPSLNLEDLQPQDVFEKRLEKEELTEKSRNLLLEAFREVYESVLSSEKK